MNKSLIMKLFNEVKEAQNTGNFIKEKNANQKLYNIFKKKLGKKDPFTLDLSNSLANSYRHLGFYNKALGLYREVYAARKEILGKRHHDTLTTLANVAVAYGDIGKYNRALEINKVVYNTRKEVLGENHPDTLSSLNNLAKSYYDLGDYQKAFELQKEVYIIRKGILGENHPVTLTSLSNLAVFYIDIGDYSKALELNKKVYTISKELFGEEHPYTLDSLFNLASNYSYLGYYSKSLELIEAVLNRIEILGKRNSKILAVLNNLAVLYGNLGDYYKALDLKSAVYNIEKEVLGESHHDTLTTLANLAGSYADIGDYNKALEINKKVYDSIKKKLGAKNPDVLSVLNNLANRYSDLGEYSKALEINKAVYNLRKEIQKENHPDTLSSLYNIASSHLHLGEVDKALEINKKVYNTRKDILGENHPDTLLVLSDLIATQMLQEEINDKSIQKHMTAYFENIKILKATAFNINEVSSRRNFLKSFNNVYRLLKFCVFERSIYDLLDYLFINKNLSFEMDVSIFHKKTMDDRLSLEKVINSINNQLIIDFYELPNSKYGLILIKDGEYLQYVVDFEDIINGSFINDEDIQSFIGSLEDYDHIYICPDGKLYNISFERVFNCSNISYLSSVQTLFKKNTDDDNTNQLVSFVYPDFSGRLSDDNDRGDTVGVLYGSYLEGIFIHDIYGEKSTIYSSYQANYDNFLNIKRPRILHVSTHGDFLDNEHMEPMDRGILCLSGYNVDENDSGYISAREIQYMDLKGTELAVLSACNTGLGENISGEGIYGIRRAFELAGCQTLLLTVEEVDDFNSAIFMKSFYERYNDTNNIYQSFKETKEYLKEHGLKELQELKDVFEKEMKNKINSRIVYTRNLKELNRRIEESEKRGQIVRKKNGEYVVEDWNGFIIQGKIENS